jgi:hypothetical protein
MCICGLVRTSTSPPGTHYRKHLTHTTTTTLTGSTNGAMSRCTKSRKIGKYIAFCRVAFIPACNIFLPLYFFLAEIQPCDREYKKNNNKQKSEALPTSVEDILCVCFQLTACYSTFFLKNNWVKGYIWNFCS